jgi:hypothetical protein
MMSGIDGLLRLAVSKTTPIWKKTFSSLDI